MRDEGCFRFHTPMLNSQYNNHYVSSCAQYDFNGSTVTGRLVKRCPRPTDPKEPQLWLVAPSDRRRKNEKISEMDLRKVDEEDASSGPKRKSSRSGSSQGSKASDDNNAKASSSSTGSASNVSKKRKSDDVSDTGSAKKVTFKEEKTKKKKSVGGMRVGTRATRNSGHELFDGSKELPRKKATKKIKKNEHVTVVQMLTGTLYLYKGETRRAEFVRSKY